MLARVTDLLEGVGLLLLIAAATAAAAVGIPAPWNIPAALAVAGVGLIVTSVVIVLARRGGAR